MYIEGLLPSKLCSGIMFAISNWNTIKTVKKTSSFKTKLIGNIPSRAEITEIPFDVFAWIFRNHTNSFWAASLSLGVGVSVTVVVIGCRFQFVCHCHYVYVSSGLSLSLGVSVSVTVIVIGYRCQCNCHCHWV